MDPSTNGEITGVADNKEKIGLDEDSIKEVTQNKIISFLENIQPNRSFYNDIRFDKLDIDGKLFAFIEIKNRPDKPFFLKKDYKDRKKIVRAGVIYTRNRDGNTPITGSALDDEIELMWRERFSLNRPALERFELYLSANKWKEGGDNNFYCEDFPDFRVKIKECKDNVANVPEADKWMPSSWIMSDKIMVHEYSGWYQGVNITKKPFIIWWLDNNRIPVPLPEIKSDYTAVNPDQKGSFEWYISRYSLKYKIGNIIAESQGMKLDEILEKTKIEIKD